MQEFNQILFQVVIPVLGILLGVASLAVSYLFYRSGKAETEKAQYILTQIEERGKGWQNDIIKTTTNMLDASPNIVGSKIFLAKLETASKLTKLIENASAEILSDPSKKDSLELVLKYHYHYLNELLGIKQEETKKTDQSQESKTEAQS